MPSVTQPTDDRNKQDKQTNSPTGREPKPSGYEPMGPPLVTRLENRERAQRSPDQEGEDLGSGSGCASAAQHSRGSSNLHLRGKPEGLCRKEGRQDSQNRKGAGKNLLSRKAAGSV